MKRSIIFVISTCILLCMTSCATIFYGDRGKVTINAYPTYAKADRIEISKSFHKDKVETDVHFPYVLPTRYTRGASKAEVKVYKDDYVERFTINKCFNGWFLGNLFFGEIPGMIIDLVSGCYVKPRNDTYYVSFPTTETNNK